MHQQLMIWLEKKSYAENGLVTTKVLITKLPIDGYDFITENSVTYYKMSETSDPRVGFSRDFFKYKLIYDEILIKMNNGSEHNLNRSTGSRRLGYTNSTDMICKPLNDDNNIRKMFNKIHKLRLENLNFKLKILNKRIKYFYCLDLNN